MISSYNSNSMYRHQQSQQNPPPVHSWYAAGYHHQNHQMGPPATYCMQEEQQMWHHSHSMFHNAGEFQEFLHGGAQPHQVLDHTQMPSPTVTVSGSDMSSPGAASGNLSPQQNGTGAVSRPPPARSPFEWIKKTSYQVQPNPGKTRTKDKYRVVYTDHQRIELEKEFTFVNRYITIRRKSELAASLGLSDRQVKIWFQNRRAKERKQNKKRIEEKNQIEMSNGLAYPAFLPAPPPPPPQDNTMPTLMHHHEKNNHFHHAHHQYILGMNALQINDKIEKMEKLEEDEDDFPPGV